MTTQDNTIDGEEKSSFVFHQLNRLLIVGLSTTPLAFDGYQTTDIFYAVSVVSWLWLPEIEAIERKVAKSTVKQLFIVLMTAFIGVALYMVLREFIQINQLPSAPEIWILLAIISIGVISYFYKTIIWLASNNPIHNIGKEFNEGALK